MARKPVDDYSWVDHAGRDDIVVKRVLRGRKVVYHLCRTKVDKAICHVDTLRFVLAEIALADHAGEACESADDYAVIVSRLLAEATGFGLGDQIKPRDFYDSTWGIGPNAVCGHVAAGGGRQHGTVLVSITGVGCMAFRPGWEQRLHDLLDPLRPRITRGDAARDIFDGALTVHDARKAWHAGEMDRYHNRPVIHLPGEWEGGDRYNKGLTVNVGTRESPLEVCVYEKGKQLGDPDSVHVRVEARFRDNHHIIPWDFLVRPQDYFVSGNAFLAQFSVAGEEPVHLERKAKYVDRTWEHLVHHAKRCYGPLIKLGRAMYGDADILNMLQADHDRWPRKLDIGDHEYPGISLHERDISPYVEVVTASYDERKLAFEFEQMAHMPRRIRSAMAELYDWQPSMSARWAKYDELLGQPDEAYTFGGVAVWGAKDAAQHGYRTGREQIARQALGVLPSDRQKSFNAYQDGNSLSPVPRVIG